MHSGNLHYVFNVFKNQLIMYIPSIYKNTNIDEVTTFIDNNGFAIVISAENAQIQATHVPLLLDINKDGNQVLVGHISKGNPQSKLFINETSVLVIFNGPHSYISSSWYDHENVPTWNYIAVHITGKVKLQTEFELIDSLKKIVNKYEKDSLNPVSMETMSEDVINNDLKGIVGFEIRIDKIEAAYKLSQNRDENNYNSIIKNLNSKSDSSSKEIANEMSKHCPFTK